MNKILNILTWSGGVVALFVMAAFSEHKQEDIFVESIDIQIDYTEQQYFVTKKDIEKIIKKKYPKTDSLLYREINIKLLEESLDNHPSIQKAEVYSALDGELRIQVAQKKPVFRVRNSLVDYYITEEGDSMALSPNFSAQVPLVTGAVSAKSEQEVFEFFGKMKEDEFFNDFFTGINVEENGEWTLFPRPGRHLIYIGKPANISEKMERLRIFYQSVIDPKNIDSIKTLNLAYNKQVICTKY